MARPSKKNPTGAQKAPKRTPEVLKKLEEAFAMDCTVGEACFYATIGESTYHEWIKAEPKLSERFKELRNKPVLKARSTILKNLNDPKTAQWYLERKRKAEFAVRVENDHTSTDGTMSPTKIIIVTEDDD